MKNRNVKVVDEHNIDRDANVMFALELDGSEYVVYWISRDEESNNVFVSKVLRNVDGTYNMLNIEEDEKKKEIADIVKTLISNSVSDQNDKMVGTTTTLSNGKVASFVNVLFNKEQHISVAKTYITTVKKEVTKVAENYYDVVVEEAKVEAVLPAAPVVESVQEVFPEIAPVAAEPVAPVLPEPQPVTVESTPVVETLTPEVAAVVPPVVEPAMVAPTPVAEVQPSIIPEPVVVAPEPVAVVASEPVAPVIPTPVVPTPVVEAPVVVASTPVVETPAPVVSEPVNQGLVFNASKESNLNAALGEAANATTIPVENIEPVREFGEEAPVVAPAPVAVAPVPAAPTAVAPMVQPEMTTDPKVLKKAGFANSKFFMVVAIAFFMASCVFLGYEVYNYFQLVK